jgi:hypothetical protein
MVLAALPSFTPHANGRQVREDEPEDHSPLLASRLGRHDIEITAGDGRRPLDRFAQISPTYYGCAEANGIDAFAPHPSDEVNGLTGRPAPAPLSAFGINR